MYNIRASFKHFSFIALPNEVFIMSVILSDYRYSNGSGVGRKQAVLSM